MQTNRADWNASFNVWILNERESAAKPRSLRESYEAVKKILDKMRTDGADGLFGSEVPNYEDGADADDSPAPVPEKAGRDYAQLFFPAPQEARK
jgi:hypothetical protein